MAFPRKKWHGYNSRVGVQGERKYAKMGKIEKVKEPKPKTLDMEISVAKYFGIRQNTIVPNLYWGMFDYELDLCVLTKTGYATEIEIKSCRADLIKDKEKRHGHHNPMIKHLYFALPYHLLKDIEHVPERAGILIVRYVEAWEGDYIYLKRDAFWSCTRFRAPKINYNYQWTDTERLKLLRLAAMRTWTLKNQLQKARKTNG